MPKRRKHLSLQVKLDACLHALGLDPATVDWHHEPPLAHRPIDPATGDTIPPEIDHKHIIPMGRAAHKARTPADTTVAAKLKRIDVKHTEFRERILAKVIPDHVAPAPKRRGRPIPSRPFPKRKRP